MKYLTILTYFLIQAPVGAELCFNPTSVRVNWEAFKTPEKLSVKGTFKTVKVKALKNKVLKITDLLKKAQFEIDASTVFSKNSSRDKKIFDTFFSSMKNGAIIQGNVTRVMGTKILLDLTMNGVTKEVPLRYYLKHEKLHAHGYIDVLDFTLNQQLAELNRACFARHEGKTWNDVAISLEASVPKCNK